MARRFLENLSERSFMSDFMELIRWVECLPTQVPFKVHEVLLTRQWCAGVSDFLVTSKIHGREFSGRCVDFDPVKALGKAIIELIERVAVFENGLCVGSGVAGHFDLGGAKENGALELIERDAILYHHLTRRPFKLVDLASIKRGSERVLSCVQEADQRGVFIRFYRAVAINKCFVIVCVAKENRPGGRMLFGFGSSSDLANSIKKSLLECVQNIPFLFQSPERPFATLREFLRSGRKLGPRDHGFLGLDPEYSAQVCFLFPEKAESEYCFDEAEIHYQFEFQSLRTSIVPEDFGLRFARAVSHELIPLYWGRVPEEVSSCRRLRNCKDISAIPHFIG